MPRDQAGEGKAVEKLLPRLADDYRRLVESLADTLESVDVSKARAELRSLLGDIRVEVDDEEARFMVAGMETALARASGGPQINVVAGARSSAYMQEVELR